MSRAMIGAVMRARRRSVSGLPAVMVLLLTLLAFPTAREVSADAQTADRYFWLNNGSTWQHAPCDALGQGTHILIYGCPGSQVSTADVAAMIDAFERRIYPKDVRLFGIPRHLGQIAVVLTPLPGSMMGYFDENDLNPNGFGGDAKHSNRANVLYLRPPLSMPDADKLSEENEAVAHELQHLIEFRIRVLDHGYAAEDDWLNEGLSFYAQLANGYWTARDQAKVQAASAAPGWKVTALNEQLAFLRLHARTSYGRAGLFMSYLGTQFGPNFTRQVVANPRPGLPALDEVLRSKPYRSSLVSAFANWGVAGLLNGPGLYGYRSLVKGTVHPVLALPPVTSFPFDTQRSFPSGLNIDFWAHAYVRLHTNSIGSLRILLAGDGRAYRVAVVFQSRQFPSGFMVRWLQFNRVRRAELQLRNFGEYYQNATLVVSHVCSPSCTGDVGGSSRLQVAASLTRLSSREESPHSRSRTQITSSVPPDLTP